MNWILLSTTLFFLLSLVVFIYYLFPTRYRGSLKRFDIIFLFIFFFLLTGHLTALILDPAYHQIGWNVFPLSEFNRTIFVFSEWPWIVLRIWDGEFSYEFLLLEGVLSLFLTRIFIKFKFFAVLESIVISILSIFLLSVVIQYLSGMSISIRNLQFGGTDFLMVQSIMVGIIMLFVLFSKYYKSDLNSFPILGFTWCLFDFGIKIVTREYIPHIFGVDIYVLEALVIIFLVILYYSQEGMIHRRKRRELQSSQQGRPDRLANIRLSQDKIPEAGIYKTNVYMGPTSGLKVFFNRLWRKTKR